MVAEGMLSFSGNQGDERTQKLKGTVGCIKQDKDLEKK